MSKSLLVVGGYASADQAGISAFGFDQETDALTPVGSFAGIDNPSFLTAHPHGPWFYATGETGSGSVWALRYERDPWSITAINHQASGGAAPCHLLIDSSGKWLLAANYSSGSALVLPILD